MAYPGRQNIYDATIRRMVLEALEQQELDQIWHSARKFFHTKVKHDPAYVKPGDIIIDGGNSHYPDTIRRTAYVESKGLLYVGCGVSGGEEGALKGPSMMPGGSPAAQSAAHPPR